EFVVDDGPCPMFVATEGESFVAFLTTWSYYGPGLRPIGLPVSAVRATNTRSLAQVVGAIRAIHPLDGEARDLFAKYGWTTTAVEGSNEFDLPPLAEFGVSREIFGAAPSVMGSLDRYVALSADIGLDMRVAAGKTRGTAFVLARPHARVRSGSAGRSCAHLRATHRRGVGAHRS